MSELELKLALQREGEAQILVFWQAAEAEVSEQRQIIQAECVQLQGATDRKLQNELASLSGTVLFAAQARVLELRLHAEAALESRLLLLATQLLPELADKDRTSLWRVLRGELPQTDWAGITVHPADRALAEHEFPKAAIDDDEALCGGLVATSADGCIRIDNSLGCRLLRAWPDLLPQLLNELRKLVDDNEITDTNNSI